MEQHNLTLKKVNKDIEIGNGLVLIRLMFCDGGYAQEFYAINQRGQYQLLLSSIHKNLIPSSDHRASSSPMISGDRTHLFGVCRESLRMVYSNAEIVYQDEDRIVVRLSGSIQGHSIKCEIAVEADSNIVSVIVEDKLMRNGSDPVLEYLMSSYAFMPANPGLQLDYVWAPNLRPASDHVIGDSMFRSPAVMAQKNRMAAALIPDLDILERNRAMPAVLDLDIENGLLFAPLLSYGFCDYELTDDGRYCRHDITMSKHLHNPNLKYGYHLILNANCKKASIHREAARFLWKRYENAALQKSVIPSHIASHKVEPDMRAAYSLELDQARAIKSIVLSSGQDNGLFSTRFNAELNQWDGCKYSVDSGYYSTSECSEQLYWLLKWHFDIEKDSKVLPYCRKYADYLIDTKLRNGAIPSWYTKDHIIVSTLLSSAQTAISGLFLAELGRISEIKKYIKASEQSAQFIIKELIPRSMYFDNSCLDITNGVTFECMDSHTGVYPHSAQSLLWIAQLCLALYKLTENKVYLGYGLDIIDRLSLFQCIWDKDKSMFGLCSPQNTGIEFNAELTAEFARCFMGYGSITGEKEYFERGLAALYAALNAPVPDANSEARIMGSVKAILSTFGSSYIHIGKKWGFGVIGNIIQDLHIHRGSVSIELDRHINGHRTHRIVFGGLNGSSYKVTVNGTNIPCTNEDMEHGIFVENPTKTNDHKVVLGGLFSS